jgi:hypothetical protein
MNLSSESGLCAIVMLVYIPHKVDLKKMHHYEGFTQSSVALQYVITNVVSHLRSVCSSHICIVDVSVYKMFGDVQCHK